VFAGVRRTEDGERLHAGASGRLTPLRLDVTSEEQIEAAREVVASETAGRLAGLVNNAGIAMAGPMEFAPLDALRRQLEVNVVAQVAVTQAFLPSLRQARGRIVNIGSISGRSSLPLLGPYQISKYAMEGLSDTLRMELLPWGIHVSLVEPGAIATPIWEKSVAENDQMRSSLPAEAERLYGRQMDTLRRAALASGSHGATAEEVAQVVAHALTAPRPKTRYVIGPQTRIRVLLELLPDRLRDRIILRQLARFSS
jgi:NAD(P)-dependent dehydrogenase (short-subunit alcohol dehydrogenase family)